MHTRIHARKGPTVERSEMRACSLHFSPAGYNDSIIHLNTCRNRRQSIYVNFIAKHVQTISASILERNRRHFESMAADE
jgi:hypothetical protein